MTGTAYPETGEALDERNLGEWMLHTFLADYVKRGMGVTADGGANEITVDEGAASIAFDDQLFHAPLDTAETVPYATTAGENYVYIVFDETTGAVSVSVVDTEGAVTAPALLIAEVDGSTDAVAVQNQVPGGEELVPQGGPLTEDLDAAGFSIQNLGPLTADIDAANFDLLNVGNLGGANGFASLNGSGVLTSAEVPDLAITETFVVADESERLALTDVEEGDVAIQTDEDTAFIFTGGDPSNNADWSIIGIRSRPEISSYTPGHTAWGDGLSSEEVHRVDVASGETFVLTRSSFRQKGGGSSASADVATVVDSGSTLQTTTLGSTDADLSNTVDGPATVLITLTNSTGGEIEAAPEVNWRIE